MYKYIVLLIFSVEFVRTVIINTPLNRQEQNLSTPYENNIQTDLSIEEIKEIRIIEVKKQILEQLALTQSSPSTAKPKNTEASKEIIRLLMREEEELQQKRNRLLSSEERLVIHAKECNSSCIYSNATYCRMYNFDVSQSLNTATVNLWFYKQNKLPKWVSIVLSSSISIDERHDEYFYETHKAGWNKLKLPQMFTPPSVNESSYTIEIIGNNIEHIGEFRPFLLVSKSPYSNARQRRDVEGCDRNESCCWMSLKVSFAEIGFDWVLYPSELEANVCLGKCLKDVSTVNNHYEIAMFKVTENNNTAKQHLGECFTRCCKPKTLESVRVFYNDTEGVIHDQYIPDLSVKSCSCF